MGGGQGWQAASDLQNMLTLLKLQSGFFCACLSLRFRSGTRGVSGGVFGEQELLFCYMFPCLT